MPEVAYADEPAPPDDAVPVADADLRTGRRGVVSGLAAVVAENDATIAIDTEADLRARQRLSDDVKSVNDMKELLGNSRLKPHGQRK